MWIYCKEINASFNTDNIICIYATQNSVEMLESMHTKIIKGNINEDTANKIVGEIMSAIEQDKKVYILD